MRIALAQHRWFPHGGAQRDLLQTARVCRDAGHAVRAFVQRWDGPRPDGVEVIELPVTGRTNHGRALAFGAALETALAAAPADRLVGFDRLPSLDLYFAADPCFVARAHEARSRLYRLTPRYRALAALERAVFAPGGRCRILLLDPRQQAVFARWHGTEAGRFVVLPPGIDPDRRAGADGAALRAAVRAELGIDAHQHLLLLIGSDFRRKGLDRAIRALAALPAPLRDETRLLAVGADAPGAARALARGLGVGARVRIEPGRDDVPALLQAADLLLHPARSENTGTVLVEALAAGLPVLCSGACGHARFVAEAGAGQVTAEPFRQPALDAALAALLTADRAELRVRALAWAARTDLGAMHARMLEAIEAGPPARSC